MTFFCSFDPLSLWPSSALYRMSDFTTSPVQEANCSSFLCQVQFIMASCSSIHQGEIKIWKGDEARFLLPRAVILSICLKQCQYATHARTHLGRAIAVKI